ncbi:MAG: histidine decarboxylase, partial [Pseudomonadota bacterium]
MYSPMGTIEERIEQLISTIEKHSNRMLGYPSARDFDYTAFAPLLNFPLNNVGDPFVEGSMHVNSREFECEVLEFWARLYRAPEDNWWGYVTNGGTEGNLYGLYLARECFPDGIVYYSQDTHYSVSKNLHFLNMRNIMIRSQSNGEIDYDDLRETLRINRDVPPIIFANIGTTMTEARDDISRIREIMQELAIPAHYIHSDAALCGAYAPFLEPRPHFDFADGCDSIALSGHKFIGSPIPCGLVIARKDYVNRIARSVAYIGNLDTTVTGSRNGLTPLIMWYAIQTLGKSGLKKRIAESLNLAAYTVERFRNIGLDAWRNPNALTVVVPALEPAIVDKWQLATAHGISHIILMPALTQDHIE